jgi:MFS family permease
LVSISYREYFFPLYAEQKGISEVDIGRIYLWCGLLVIYAGPTISKNLIVKFGSKNTVIIASGMACCSILMPVMAPSLTTAVLGVILLSISISFGYAAQSTYYSTLPATGLYGESKAMSIYSLFDNGGQTLGPMIYGFALVLGPQRGLFGIGVTIAILITLFAVMNVKGKKKYVEL